ncbi:MAG: OB-fold domain-containing protein [Nocardioides sp.]|nr:OB-fold domain-containing protein [Nocardioidaceae bacterium]MCB8957838.1 OB-fold domain-containing protein [Nocardioides sp.]
MSDSPAAPAVTDARRPFRSDVVTVEPFALLGTRCAEEHITFPARDLCPTCHRTDVSTVALAGTGTLHTFSEVHQAPPGVEVPYLLGWVDLVEGCRVLARIAGGDHQPRIGDPVRCRPTTFTAPDATTGVGFEFEVIRDAHR